MERTDHLSAELHDAPVGERRLLHASAGPVARGAQARQAGARANDVALPGGILS
jgi:hypothetical protein